MIELAIYLKDAPGSLDRIPRRLQIGTLEVFVRAARKALAEQAKTERDAARATEKETKRREQRDAKQLQAMCNLMTTTLMTRLMSQMNPGSMKEILTDFTDSNRENGTWLRCFFEENYTISN